MTTKSFSPRHVLGHAEVVLEHLAVLVEVGDLQVGAMLHLAGLRGQLAEQQLEQRGLAAAVGADHADLVPAQDGGAEAGHRGHAVPGVGEVGGGDDLAPAQLGRLDGHGGGAQLAAAQAALAAQFHQRAHAALVAGAAGLHALADPRLLLGQLLVEQRVLLLLRLAQLLAQGQVAVVAVGPAGQPAAVQLDDAGGEPAQERAVVGDEQDRAVIAQQEVFKPVDGGQVEVVGGLVQQQHIRLVDQRAGQQGAALLAAGQVVEARVGIEAQPHHRLVGAVRDLPVVAAAVLRDLQHSAGQFTRDRLGQRAHPDAVLNGDHAAVRLFGAGQQAEQGGLALAVAADQGDALPALDLQRHRVQQRGSAVAHRHIV
jgi:hypothetical protein